MGITPIAGVIIIVLCLFFVYKVDKRMELTVFLNKTITKRA